MRRRLIASALSSLAIALPGACTYDFTVGTGGDASAPPAPPQTSEVIERDASLPDTGPSTVSAECGPNCTCTGRQNCVFTCAKGDKCTLACTDESTCALTCGAGSQCGIACSGESNCDLDCGAGGSTCTFECKGEAKCKGTCAKRSICARLCPQRCDVDCDDGSICL